MSRVYTMQCSSAEQSVGLLKQDKDYLTRQVSALNERVSAGDQKVDWLDSQLSEAKQAKEQLYHQLISDKSGTDICPLCYLSNHYPTPTQHTHTLQGEV